MTKSSTQAPTASGRERVGSTGLIASGTLPEFLNATQALTFMMETMTTLLAHMISMAGALGNTADVSGAREFLRDFATDAGRTHRRLARIIVLEELHAHEVNAPIATMAQVAKHVHLAPPVVADNVPVAPPVVPVNVLVETIIVVAPVLVISIVHGVLAANAPNVPVGVTILPAAATALVP